MPVWRAVGPEVRAAVCVEIVDRINARSFEIASAVMHTSGQPFVMAFQAGGPHAQDRALEAVAAGAGRAAAGAADRALGEAGPGRAAGHGRRTTTCSARGVAVVIGCNTFPTWNAYPGLFASLVDRQPGHRQAAPEGHPAAGDHGRRSPATCCPTTVSTPTW